MKSKLLIIIVVGLMLFIGCENSTETEPTDPLSTWIYLDSTYTFVSGLANRRDIFQRNPIAGITVLLTNQDIDCLDSPVDVSQIGGAWIGVRFPGLEIRDYGMREVQGMSGFWGLINGIHSSSNISGSLGRAGLTFIDTAGEKRVRGWLDFENIGGFEEGEVSSAYGTFDVPYCSAALDSEYIPKEPISSWTYRDSTRLIVSGIAERRRSDQGNFEDGITVYLTDLEISCGNSPFSPPYSAATITIKFPDIAQRPYTSDEIGKTFKVYGEYFNPIFESLGPTGLTFVDTTNTRRVQGWIAIERRSIPYINAYGTFDVPFCPENQ